MLTYTFNWSVVWQHRVALTRALLLSSELAAAVLPIGCLFGLIFAYAAFAQHRTVRHLALIYVHAVRNTPPLLLVFTFYLVLPEYGFRALDAKASFIAALSIVAGGYMAENFRAALGSIPVAYLDGARAIGLTAWKRQAYVVFPIAIRYALPSLTNSAVAVFKDTSLASVIAVQELTYFAREISTNYFRVFEGWVAVAGVYLAVSTAMAFLARSFERHLPRLT